MVWKKMESGINARAVDFAKFGRLFSNNERCEGKQIVSQTWVEQATQPEERPSSYYQGDAFFVAQSHHYRYFWWGSKRLGGRSDFYGVGNRGQYVYVCPQRNLIIVRNGIDHGLPSERWARLFYDFASTM